MFDAIDLYQCGRLLALIGTFNSLISLVLVVTNE